VTKAASLDEQLVDMKTTPDKLLKENAKKDVQIKLQNKQIANLIKGLGKWSPETSNKGSGGEDSNKESNQNKQFDD